jgi:hypothetical protein
VSNWPDDPRSPEERAKVLAMLREAKDRLRAQAEERKLEERRASLAQQGAGPEALSQTESLTVEKAEREFWARKLSEADPLIVAELRRVRVLAENTEATQGDLMRALVAAEKRIEDLEKRLLKAFKHVGERLRKLEGGGTNGRASGRARRPSV